MKSTRLQKWSEIWAIVGPIFTILAILGTSAILIAYGRGYRIRPKEDKLVASTGLVSVTSDPVGAQILVDNELKSATNNSINVDPGKHTMKIVKEGYFSWQKELDIQKEVVSRADAFLFPVNPSLSPLTSSGVEKPLLSPDGSKVSYLVLPAKDEKAEKIHGIWVYELSDRTLGFNRDPKHIATTTDQFDFKNSVLLWSPDSQQLLVDSPREARLYQTARTDEFTIVTEKLDTLLVSWEEETKTKESQKLSAFKQDVINVATTSAKILSFSPDETKILYVATGSATIPQIITPPLIGTNSTREERTISPGTMYVYDSKEDKNYKLLVLKELNLPTPTPTPRGKSSLLSSPTPLTLSSFISSSYPISWFPTSRHLILTLPGKIDILEYDRTNWLTVYAGPFEKSFVAPWPGGSRIVVMTNLNPGVLPFPNLYTVNLR